MFSLTVLRWSAGAINLVMNARSNEIRLKLITYKFNLPIILKSFDLT